MKMLQLVLTLIIAINLLCGCLPHVEFPKENHKTYMTADENIYFYTDFRNETLGKFRTSTGEIYELTEGTLGRIFELQIRISQYEGKTIYHGSASYEEDKFTFRIESRPNDIDPTLPDTIVFYERDGEVIPDWAKETYVTYMTADEDLYFYMSGEIARNGKLLNSDGSIVNFYVENRKSSFQFYKYENYNRVDFYFNYTNNKYQYYDDVINFVLKNPNAVSPILGNKLTLYKHDGRIVPEWAE